MIKKVSLRRLAAGLGSAVVALGGVAVLFTAAPAVASTSTSASLTYACKYNGSQVRSAPRIMTSTEVGKCQEGQRIFPTCWVRGDYSRGDNRWYSWASKTRFIHFSQVTVSGSGGAMTNC